MKPNIDIPESARATVVDILNRLLSDEYVLLTKTRNDHWNVTGPQFNDLHKFFEAQYDELNEIVASPAATEMIRALLSDHEAIARSVRADIGPVAEKFQDIGTSDYLTGLLEKHEKMAWMLRAFLG